MTNYLFGVTVRVRLVRSLITLTERKYPKSHSWCEITAVPSQVADLKTRNQQLDSENTELSQRNSKNQADVQDLNQQLARVLKQKEREEGKCTLEEWEKERLLLKEELENSKIEVQHCWTSGALELASLSRFQS